ncbi:hypothetical protein GUJ93_ZPchr0001g31783 [Zizania palustris]|uniref:Uncharacterized protein n=1 Tax=Zizania palustris TaxID=103762 RepID=A0A8J5VMC6_ZIZPA|nr:hypothetical protein GUJ93_ZPchr0001g31783 [Zizania palustris]
MAHEMQSREGRGSVHVETEAHVGHRGYGHERSAVWHSSGKRVTVGHARTKAALGSRGGRWMCRDQGCTEEPRWWAGHRVARRQRARGAVQVEAEFYF